MRIASKLNTVLSLALAGGTMAILGVMQSTIQPKFDEIERNTAEMNHERITGALEAATDKLRTAAQDYSYWDETYNFMQGIGSDEFIASNLTPEAKAVENLGVNALVFYDLSGSVTWGVAYDLETQEPIVDLVKDLADFNTRHPVLEGDPTHLAKGGLVRTSRGLVLVAVAPIQRSDRTGQMMGKVIAAKLLDPQEVRDLTGVEFQFDDLAKGAAEGTPALKLTTTPAAVETVSVINDLSGKPLVMLTAKTPRDVSLAGAAAVRSAMGMMIVVGVMVTAVLWWFLNRGVIRRIEELKNHIVVAGSSGRIRLAGGSDGSDEIGDLARAFNGMANQVNHLRDALADSAYMTGLSEWAAGTLHNVRNGLVPVASMTWQIEKLFDAAWIKNVATASAECANSDTPPERREKLNAFLLGSSQRFSEAANQTRALTGEINTAGQSVLAMVAEFERYAHHKTEIGPVDVLTLLQDVSKSSVGTRSQDAEVVLPKTTATVLANDVILRQIITNIFVNALEAMEPDTRRGRIDVSLRTDVVGALISIAIKDNGEGVGPDRLKTIFQRGISSRTGRSGGLGLHWCANAVKLLGGTIHAESAGPGTGTTLVVCLPAVASTIEEAA